MSSPSPYDAVLGSPQPTLLTTGGKQLRVKVRVIGTNEAIDKFLATVVAKELARPSVISLSRNYPRRNSDVEISRYIEFEMED